jgi:CobQ/CobB/MinD/ParA nucleotide binding domain
MNSIIENTLNVVANGKGGEGKSTVTAATEDWLCYQGINHALLDCDDNRSLTKMHPQAQPHRIKSTDDIQALIAKILESNVTLADTPANITSEITALFSHVQFGTALEVINGKLVILVPVSASDAASFEEVGRLVAAVQKGADYVVVKNEKSGSDFSQFDQSTAGQCLRVLGASEIRFPRFEDKLQSELNARRLSLAQFIGYYWDLQKSDPRGFFNLTFFAQMATKHLQSIFLELNDIAPILLPTASVAKVREITSEGIKTACCQAWGKKQATKSKEKQI